MYTYNEGTSGHYEIDLVILKTRKLSKTFSSSSCHDYEYQEQFLLLFVTFRYNVRTILKTEYNEKKNNSTLPTIS